MPKTPTLPPIHTVRRQRVVLDSDLARLYGVSTKAFNQTIRRNTDRFPPDFLLQLTAEEVSNLRSQFVTSSLPTASSRRSPSMTLKAHGGRRYLSLAFTEHGAIMAATLLRSPRAVAMSVYVVRAFVQMKDALLTNAMIFRRLAELDKKLVTHDVILRDVYEKLRPLICLEACRRTQLRGQTPGGEHATTARLLHPNRRAKSWGSIPASRNPDVEHRPVLALWLERVQ